jgi:hypothetical protein
MIIEALKLWDLRLYITRASKPSSMFVNSAGDEEAEQLEFRIIDYGHARLAKNKALAKLPKAPGLELSYRK